MFVRLRINGLVFFILFVFSLTLIFSSTPFLAAQLDPTEQQQTIDAAIQQWFQQTAQAQSVEAQATAIQAAIETQFAVAQTATASAFASPAALPTLTATRLPPTSTRRPTAVPTIAPTPEALLLGREIISDLARRGTIGSTHGEFVVYKEAELVDLTNYTWWNINRQITSQPVSNFVMHAEFMWGPGDMEDACGFFFRENSRGWYLFAVNQFGLTTFNKNSNGNWGEGSQWNSDVNAGFGNTNEMVVVGLDDTFTLFTNGQRITAIEDRSFTSGQVSVYGISTYNPEPSSCFFTDIWVWTPDQSTSSANTTTASADVTALAQGFYDWYMWEFMRFYNGERPDPPLVGDPQLNQYFSWIFTNGIAEWYARESPDGTVDPYLCSVDNSAVVTFEDVEMIDPTLAFIHADNGWAQFIITVMLQDDQWKIVDIDCP